MEDKYSIRHEYTSSIKRVPVCFCIDTSESMDVVVDGLDSIVHTGKMVEADGRQMEEVSGGITVMDKLNDGLVNFHKAVKNSDAARESCDSAIVIFSEKAIVLESFSPTEGKKIRKIYAHKSRRTNISDGIRKSMELINQQQQYYKSNDIPAYKPWLVIFTDGRPDDDVSQVQRELVELQKKDKLRVYTMLLDKNATNDVKNILRGFSTELIECSDYRNIKKFFDFITKSVSTNPDTGMPKNFF